MFNALRTWPTLLKGLTVLLSSGLVSLNSQADAERWYQIEVALIAYQDEARIDHEYWPEVMAFRDETHPPGINDDTPWLDWWNNPILENETFTFQGQGIMALSEEAAQAEVLAHSEEPALSEKTNDHHDHGLITLARPYLDQGVAFEPFIERTRKRKNMQVLWSQRWDQPRPPTARCLTHTKSHPHQHTPAF